MSRLLGWMEAEFITPPDGGRQHKLPMRYKHAPLRPIFPLGLPSTPSLRLEVRL